MIFFLFRHDDSTVVLPHSGSCLPQPCNCCFAPMQYIHWVECVWDDTEMHLYPPRHAKHWHRILSAPCMLRKAEKQKHLPSYSPQSSPSLTILNTYGLFQKPASKQTRPQPNSHRRYSPQPCKLLYANLDLNKFALEQ